MATYLRACVAVGILCSAGSGFASDIIVFPSQSGDVRFPHREHQEFIRDCGVCHKTSPGSIRENGLYRPHRLCIGCHQEKKSGPVNCVDCHEKRR